jgi:N-acyl-D-amino-acid deacylase
MRKCLWWIAIYLTFAASVASGNTTYDLLIRNGRIVDGTGNAWFHGDVAVQGERIVAVGKLDSAKAKQTIDANNRIVSPGFVDMHSHASWSYLVDSRALSKLTQGITLEVEGEGSSVAPMDDTMAKRQAAQFARFGVNGDWRSFGDFFRRLEENPGTINFSSYLGTSTVRELVVGFVDRPATKAELAEMCEITAAAMRDGALGIYSALMYSPDRYNRTEELIAMARVAAQYGGVYQTHQRSESDSLFKSLEEIFRIAREAQIPAHITHLKVSYQQNWGKMPQLIAKVQEARHAGLDITADMYPYEQAAGSLTALLPPWTQNGGAAAIEQRLRNANIRKRLKIEMTTPTSEWENEYYGTAGGPAGITIIDAMGNPKLKTYEGRTLADIAQAEKRDPLDVLFDIILAGDVGITVLITSEQDIRTAIQVPWIAFGSDGATVAPDGPLSESLVHPRGYGTFPRIFGRYVRELKLLTLEEAVRRATSLATQRLNIRNRGLLREGFYADIVVFDENEIIDTATFLKPHQLAKGVHYVVVNGQLVLDQGKVTAARPGKVVRGPGFRLIPQ